MDLFVDLCGVVAPFLGVVCFLSPIPTIRKVEVDKSVGSLPLLPYSSMIANASVWVVYGLMKSIVSVWASNGAGVLLGAYYFTIYSHHSKNVDEVFFHRRVVSGIILLVLLMSVVLRKEVASELIGKMGVCFCVILFGSPLAALRTVVETKSAESIPLPFTVATLVNCTAWTTIGLWKFDHDFNIYFPNILGVSCALAQIALKIIYNKPVAEEKRLPS